MSLNRQAEYEKCQALYCRDCNKYLRMCPGIEDYDNALCPSCAGNYTSYEEMFPDADPNAPRFDITGDK